MKLSCCSAMLELVFESEKAIYPSFLPQKTLCRTYTPSKNDKPSHLNTPCQTSKIIGQKQNKCCQSSMLSLQKNARIVNILEQNASLLKLIRCR
ncbi:hypothetical protein JHK82_042308 [Glycine max]|uniref:Uncharacterized protein n=2 Tax=Glycine subgen. Soja TaxID=1462606 RepID=A0A0R0G0S2_SOYBN|nr:hypothetical protein JHK87_042264 [Glycine soja]KAG4949112.1 hypothetical protein JHK86_042351 [Glycine max]KAG4956595.1 hypothetical protein JHK85_042975 [Glycine max]KAG5105338.1 hypothetical protein JHK82_042308 [Glycine max]KAG5116464.1 hypothetical protein JHK84_042577 [Glycine max]